MESIRSTANAASKMVFGDGQTTQSGTEPVSGQTGQGTRSDPYDGGNAQDGTAANTTKNTSTDTGANDGVTGTTPHGDGAASTAGRDVGAAAPDSSAGPVQSQQGGERPAAEPSSTETDAIQNKKDSAETEMQRDPNDKSGEPLQSHGSEGAGHSGNDEGNKSSMGSSSTEKGTGEMYVKSTGLAADGGDFDATKPGAGREADRLLEEKGIHRDQPGGPSSTGGSGAEEKHGVGSKIKDKLHMGGH